MDDEDLPPVRVPQEVSYVILVYIQPTTPGTCNFKSFIGCVCWPKICTSQSSGEFPSKSCTSVPRHYNNSYDSFWLNHWLGHNSHLISTALAAKSQQSLSESWIVTYSEGQYASQFTTWAYVNLSGKGRLVQFLCKKDILKTHSKIPNRPKSQNNLLITRQSKLIYKFTSCKSP